MNAAKRQLRKRFQKNAQQIETALPLECTGTVIGPAAANKPNFLRVRLPDKSIVEAYNDFLPPAIGLRVRMVADRQAGWWHIVSVRNTGSDTTYPLIKRHGDVHSWRGGDVTYVDVRQILQLRVSVNVSNQLAIDIHDGWYLADGQAKYYAGLTNLSLASKRPGTGARWVLVSLQNGVARLVSGVASSALSESQIPALPDGEVGLAVIRLFAGATRIRDQKNNTDLHDIRFTYHVPASSNYVFYDDQPVGFNDAFVYF